MDIKITLPEFVVKSSWRKPDGTWMQKKKKSDDRKMSRAEKLFRYGKIVVYYEGYPVRRKYGKSNCLHRFSCGCDGWAHSIRAGGDDKKRKCPHTIRARDEALGR